MLKTSDLIAYPSRATAADMLDGLEAALGYVPAGADVFLKALDYYATRKGIDFVVIGPHSANECDLYRDSRFKNKRDGFGIAVYGDGSPGASFASYDDAAFYAVAEYCLKLYLPLTDEEVARAYAINKTKWTRVWNLVWMSGDQFPIIKTVSQMNTKFGDNDCWWMCDPNGPKAIVQKAALLLPNVPDQTDQPSQPGGSTGMGVTIGNRPLRIAVGAGHHDTARGNPYETDLNGRKANALIKELRKRGHDVYSTHPNDGLGYAPYDYNEVARRLVQHVNATGWKPDYHIECHSEGSSPGKCGSFILYPDNGNDVDVDLRDAGGVFAIKLKERTGIDPCTILTTSPGVSSETQSGVGLEGFRLGVFANTEPLNAYCTRLIWEAGAHTCAHDKAIMDRSDFPQLHALATADALEAFAKTRLGWTGKGATTPDPKPPKPTPVYANPDTSWMGNDIEKGTPSDHSFTVTVGGENVKVKVWGSEREYEVVKATPRYQGPDTKGKKVGENLKVREQFVGSYFTTVGKTRWVVTKWGSWIRADALTPRVSVRAA